jgi:hypothetical protein
MSTHPSDGMGEVMDDLLRQALMVAARLGEIAARARQDRLAQAQAASERQGRELTARFEAERHAARSSLAGVRTGPWWNEAGPEQIGAAYKTATSWAVQDEEIAGTLRHMDVQLAARGVQVTGSMPERVDDLIRAREWLAREDPFMDGSWTREMARTRTAEERDRLNVGMVSAWLNSPEGHEAKAAERAGSINGSRGEGDAAQFVSVEAGRLRGEATREEDAANGHHLEGNRAMDRAQAWEEMAAPDRDGPSADDMDRVAEQEKDHEETVAHHEWDTADRREEFAASLHGKADKTAVDARVLADVSQGTHPREAVKAAPRNAPKARKTKPTHGTTLTKGSR